MLARQNRRRHKNCRLLAAKHTLHDRTQRDFGFAKADIAAQQAIHGAFGFHILLDFLYTAQLILGFLMFERRFKFMLPAVILLKGIAAFALALCIQRNQIDCQLFDCRFPPRPNPHRCIWKSNPNWSPEHTENPYRRTQS